LRDIGGFLRLWLLHMQMGSRALITLRHSLAHFDQICIVLGLILVNPEWSWFLKRQIVHFQIWNHIWIPIWELYTSSLLWEKMCSPWAPFSQLRVILGPILTSLERRLFGISGIMGLKIYINFFIPFWEIYVGSRALAMLRHSFAHFDQIHIVLGLILVNLEWRWFLKRKILHLQIWNHIWIPFWELYTWSWLRAKMCSSWAPFYQLRVILGPSLTRPEWRLFGRSWIMGLKIQNIFLIPIWEMQVGSRALVTLRHSFAHFDQIRIVLGSILVNPKWRWFLKRKILHLQIWNHIWRPIWELYTSSRLWEKTCSSWAPFS
jgi:hypothetical protein